MITLLSDPHSDSIFLRQRFPVKCHPVQLLETRRQAGLLSTVDSFVLLEIVSPEPTLESRLERAVGSPSSPTYFHRAAWIIAAASASPFHAGAPLG